MCVGPFSQPKPQAPRVVYRPAPPPPAPPPVQAKQERTEKVQEERSKARETAARASGRRATLYEETSTLGVTNMALGPKRNIVN